MSEQRPEHIKKQAWPEANAGVFKEKEKQELEDRVVDTMRRLGSKLTKKEILALAGRIEAARNLDDLKKSLEGESKLSKIPDDVLEEVYRLIQEARELTESGLRELRLNIGKTNPTRRYEIDKGAYYSNRFAGIRRFEESELGKNLVIDLGWFAIGAIDSAIGIAKMLVLLIGDLFLLPKHAYDHYAAKKRSGGTGGTD